MIKTHNYNFWGGEILNKMGAAWFAAYAYYTYVDPSFMAWNCNITSLQSRISKFNNSKKHHRYWLEQVLHMKQLDKIPNRVGLNADKILKLGNLVLSSCQNFE